MLIVSPGKKLDAWVQAIHRADPGIRVLQPAEVENTGEVTFALAWKHPQGFFLDYPNLRCISSFGAGVDHILEDPHIPPDVQVVRIVDPLLSQDMLEFALAVCMKRLRGLTLYRQKQDKGLWKKAPYLRMADVGVGIMGTGMIGHHVAEGLAKTGFRVSGWSRTPGRQGSYRKYQGQEQLADFLHGSDILICLLPLTPATRAIIDQHLLAQLPPGAYVVNLGRGTHVVDQDLIDVIDSGHLSGAHLDVFEPEPLPPGHPLWAHAKIDITPHVASLTSPGSVAPQLAENYHRLREGRPLMNLVSREAGY